MMPGFVAIYHWRLKPEMEDEFISAWTEVTVHYLKHGSLGSRLHKCGDGTWYAYAQWPSSHAREMAVGSGNLGDARSRMKQAILLEFDDIELNPVKDYLVLPPQ